jgi:CTP:molybdopterin cytidylyltransferase MocA
MAHAAVTGGGSVTGIVLAAGAGSRMGMPKALLSSHGVPWLARASALLRAGGCRPVLVVLGADAERARVLLPPTDAARILVTDRWEDGLSHSLRAGLAEATGTAVLVTVVDTPELPLAVLQRLLAQPVGPHTLRQAVYAGAPGHPAVIGSAHWAPLAADLDGDAGARRYLVAHGVEEVECGDLFDGRDIDTPEQLDAATA